MGNFAEGSQNSELGSKAQVNTCFFSAYWANCIDRYAMCRFFDEKVVLVWLCASSRVNFNKFLGCPENFTAKIRNLEGF